MIIDDINLAAEILLLGEIVAFPTETVYGLGACASNQEACLKIYAAKGRPANNPLIVHVGSLEQAFAIGEFNDKARHLTKFWPGPLTIVTNIKANNYLAPALLSNLNTVAIRLPQHETALELINRSGGAIAAPSANRSGYISATSAEAVDKDFAGKIPILKGKVTYGIESTIISLQDENCRILRHGFITQELLEKELSENIATSNGKVKIEAPGMMAKHYAPQTSVKLNITEFDSANQLVLSFGVVKNIPNNLYNLNLSPNADLMEACANLYKYLRILDEIAQTNPQISCISVTPIPFSGIGVAINDRLMRAAA
ncbi:MAG: threonylcarbamoyl-AMP synthase [Rickettsiaceae bacterium]|nr:threonylcarbamoyl-AMP synthase [Rickettsiaceae bacterium]